MNQLLKGLAGCAVLACAAAAMAGPGVTYVNETGLPEEADVATLAPPIFLEIDVGAPTGIITGEIFEDGVTNPVGADPNILAELGYGPAGTDPLSSGDWQWAPAKFSGQVVNTDQYSGEFNVSFAGSYAFTFRFSVDNGLTWTLADTDGAGSLEGVDYSALNLGVLIVNDVPQVLDFANFKTRFFVQTTPSPETTPVSFAASQRLFGVALNPASIGTAQVLFPDVTIRPLNTYGGNQFVSRFDGPFTTEAALDAALPQGLHIFQLTGGSLGDGFGLLDQPLENRWPSPPRFANFAAYQNVDSSADFTILYDTPVTHPMASEGGVFYSVTESGSGAGVLVGFIGYTELPEFTIPASTLQPGLTYNVQLVFTGRTVGDPGANAMSTATGLLGWDSITTASLRTVPPFCAGDANWNGSVNFADITTVLVNFGFSYSPGTGVGDADRNGVVNFADITTVLVNFGNSCP